MPIHRVVFLMLAAIGVSSAPGLRGPFTTGDPVEATVDIHDAEGVRVRDIGHFRDTLDAQLRRGDRSKEPAMDINTIDEVPDSSWFHNRILRQPMSPEAVAIGPNTTTPAGPWTVTSGKLEGVTPGLQMKDASGQLYFVKFDAADKSELASGAEVISTKLLYAAGYFVPENYVIAFARDDLRIAPGATTRGADGKKRPMTAADLDALLARVARRSDGGFRALGSKALAGTPLGPFSYRGIRADDPNDDVPHEHRRALRGLRVFAAWINHVDVKDENSLDTLIVEDGRHVVRHNLLDFGSTLGHAGTARSGYEYLIDPRSILLSLVTAGLHVAPWTRIAYPDIPSVGRLEADHFNPASWKPTFPNRAFLDARPDDLFWAARRVAAFSDDDIRGAVAAAEYSDPRAADIVARTLMERRDRIARQWLTDVNPLVNFTIDTSDTLTFRNAAADAAAAPAAAAYRLRWFEFDNVHATVMRRHEAITTTRMQVRVPDDLKQAAFIGVDAGAVHPSYKQWENPLRVYFRNTATGWQLVGLERLPS